MSPVLVYLHIPKSAGTSQRAYLFKVYGEENVFWYGLDSDRETFDRRETAEYPVIGGHRPLSFYPRNFNAVFSAVVRDPVDRAISYFNYCTSPPTSGRDTWKQQQNRALEYWRENGVDPASMLRSIENCAEFRNNISDVQCAYLSRNKPTLAGVKRTLEKERFIVGLFDQLDKFNDFLQLELDFQLVNGVKANVGAPGYSSGISSEPGLIDLIRELNKEDEALFDFLRDEHAGLFVSAGELSDIKSRVRDFQVESNLQSESAAGFDWSDAHLFSKGLVKLQPGERVSVPISILNASRQNLVLVGGQKRSCTIGWQLMDEAGSPIDGARGRVQVKATVAPGQMGLVHAEVLVGEDTPSPDNAKWIEFCLVDGDTWMNTKYPLNSCWARIHAN